MKCMIHLYRKRFEAALAYPREDERLSVDGEVQPPFGVLYGNLPSGDSAEIDFVGGVLNQLMYAPR
jgi:hypothetical protein